MFCVRDLLRVFSACVSQVSAPHSFCPSYRLQEENQVITPRLFECSNQTGRFLATEIFDFNQDDLEEEDVFLLDVWDQVGQEVRGLTFPTLVPTIKRFQ